MAFLEKLRNSEDKKISYIAADVQPCEFDPCPSISPSAVAQYILEINAGEAGRIGLKIGGKAVFSPQ